MEVLEPLVETIQAQKSTKEMNGVMETLVECMQEFKTRGQGQFSQSEALEGLCFVDTKTSGLNMATLVDMGATHNILSE